MYLLGYDIGSSSVKASLVDSQTGECVASDHFLKNEAPIISLRPGCENEMIILRILHNDKERKANL